MARLQVRTRTLKSADPIAIRFELLWNASVVIVELKPLLSFDLRIIPDQNFSS